MPNKNHFIKTSSIPNKGGSPIWMSNEANSDHDMDEYSTLRTMGNSNGEEVNRINSKFNKGQGDVGLEVHKGSLISDKDLVGHQKLPIENGFLNIESSIENSENLVDMNVLGRSRSGSDIIFFKEDGSILPEREYPVNIILREKKQLDGYVIGIKNNDKEDINWVMIRGEPIIDDSGNVERVALYSMDITELKNDQINLESKRIELEGTIGRITNELDLVKGSITQVNKYDSKIQILSKTGSFEYDPVTKIFKGSEMFNRILNIDEGISIEMDSILSRIPPKEKTSFEKILDETKIDGNSKIIEINFSNEEESVPILVKLVSHVDPIDNREIVIGIIQDISHEKFSKTRLDNMSKEIENINKIMLDRETRVIEIKEEVNKLCRELGKKPKYENL